MKDIELPEPLGYMNAGHVHELQQGRLHYGYVYPKGGTGAEDAVYTADQLRAAVEADRAQRVPEGCYLSWGGFNIHGDSKSIQEVNRLMHEAGTVPDLKAMLAQSYKELAKEAPELCDPSCATYDVAAMVMSDCGHSTNNQRLLDRIAARIDKHVESLIVSTPAQPAQQEPSKPVHWSDCATNSAPAYPPGACDCMPTPDMCRAAVEYINGPGVYEKLPRGVLDIEEEIYRQVWLAMQAVAHQEPPQPVERKPMTDEPPCTCLTGNLGPHYCERHSP